MKEINISCTPVHGILFFLQIHVPGYMIFCFFFKSMYPGTWNFDFSSNPCTGVHEILISFTIFMWNRKWVPIDGIPCTYLMKLQGYRKYEWSIIFCWSLESFYIGHKTDCNLSWKLIFNRLNPKLTLLGVCLDQARWRHML